MHVRDVLSEGARETADIMAGKMVVVPVVPSRDLGPVLDQDKALWLCMCHSSVCRSG